MPRATPSRRREWSASRAASPGTRARAASPPTRSAPAGSTRRWPARRRGTEGRDRGRDPARPDRDAGGLRPSDPLLPLPARPLRERDGPRPQRRLVPPLIPGPAGPPPLCRTQPAPVMSAKGSAQEENPRVTRWRGLLVVVLSLADAGVAPAQPRAEPSAPAPPLFRLFAAPPALAAAAPVAEFDATRADSLVAASRRRRLGLHPRWPGPVGPAARPAGRRGERSHPAGPRSRPEDRVDRPEGPRRRRLEAHRRLRPSLPAPSRRPHHLVTPRSRERPGVSGASVPCRRVGRAYAAGFAGAGAGGFGGGGIRLIAAFRASVSGRSERPEGSNCPAFFAGLSP